ncbi:uncharacterized protein LOC128334482 [Hemicordylus capensis]|uniref:uncharacterized protein LOC128334482 n=1 Tax=Hemicordylus capensis TaxID=884348 RepID=UPI002302180A|nr:uncharacterized protein LOC128334482 [Hemicordylus capensis]
MARARPRPLHAPQARRRLLLLLLSAPPPPPSGLLLLRLDPLLLPRRHRRRRGCPCSAARRGFWVGIPPQSRPGGPALALEGEAPASASAAAASRGCVSSCERGASWPSASAAAATASPRVGRPPPRTRPARRRRRLSLGFLCRRPGRRGGGVTTRQWRHPGGEGSPEEGAGGAEGPVENAAVGREERRVSKAWGKAIKKRGKATPPHQKWRRSPPELCPGVPAYTGSWGYLWPSQPGREICGGSDGDGDTASKPPPLRASCCICSIMSVPERPETLWSPAESRRRENSLYILRMP